MSKVNYHQEGGSIPLNLSTEDVTNAEGKVTGKINVLTDDEGNVVVRKAVEGNGPGQYSSSESQARNIAAGLKDQETEAARLKKEREDAEAAAKEKGKGK